MVNSLNRGYRPVAWFLLMTFFIGFVLYMVAYVGNDWYVVPVEPFHYPPDNQSAPVKLGLFWMCVYTHCRYDLKVDYMVVKYLPFKDIQYSYQNYRSLVSGIITAGMILLCLAFGTYLIFMSGFRFSQHVGFASGGLHILSSILSLIGIGIFGTQFRGSTYNNPFGWSFWLMLASVIWIIVNGISVLILTIIIEADRKGKNGNSEFNRPLMATV